MEVMKHAAIKMEEEENESDGWERNDAEQTRAGDSCNYTAETKTKHGSGGKVLRKRIRANKVLSGSLLTTVKERASGGEHPSVACSTDSQSSIDRCLFKSTFM